MLEDEVITVVTTNHFHEDVLDDNEATPGRPRLRNTSKFLCTPFT